jgi:hypothetical protein
MIQQAFISGQIGKVIYTEDDRHFLLTVEHLEKPVECRPMDLSMFFNYGAEFTTLSGAQLDLAQLKAQLIARRQAYRALTLTISGPGCGTGSRVSESGDRDGGKSSQRRADASVCQSQNAGAAFTRRSGHRDCEGHRHPI